MSRSNGNGVVFSYEARREGRTVALIRGLTAADGSVTVETEVFPVTAPANAEPQTRPFTFRTREQALRFADEAVLALEYLGCVLAE
jgi:hypothetical protein